MKPADSKRTDALRCERCGQKLHPSKAVWLERSWRTNLYSKPGTVPESESQGGFAFGPDCARMVLINGGSV
jgi:hypothetical protein